MRGNRLSAEIRSYVTLLITPVVFMFRRYRETAHSFYVSMSAMRRIGFVALNIFLSVYISTVLNGSADFSSSVKTLLAGFVFTTIVMFNLIILLCAMCRKTGIPVKPAENGAGGVPSKLRFETWFLFFSVQFIVLFLSLLANFPGAVSPDTESQWRQVQSFTFNDWHPVIHTLFIWLATRIINHYAFVVFMQIIVFSVGVGCLVATLEAWGFSKTILLITGAFIILNPYTHNIMMYAWKDLAFTILTAYISAMMINVYMSGGIWLRKYKNVIFLSLLLAIAGKIRHNGIFFTVPLICFMPFFYFKSTKKALLCPLLTIAVMLVIRYPLYSALNVEFPDNTVRESVGVPMTIMGDVMIKSPETLTPETKAFLNRIASDEEWRRTYRSGNYNSIKFVSKASGIVDSVPVSQLIRMTKDTIRNSKRDALVAVRNLTAIVWELDGRINMINVPRAAGSNTNVIKRLLNYGFKTYDALIAGVIPLIVAFTKIGWLMLALLLAGIRAYSRNGIYVLLLVVPSVAYNLGTMFLLCGKDIRFFHFNVVITLPLILVLLANKDGHYSGRVR
jgi:hypothetical protein